MRMTVPARIERSLPKEMTSLYQCLTFWYKARYVRSFKSIQILDGNVNELWHSVKITTGEWVFGEMPLDRRYTKSKVCTAEKTVSREKTVVFETFRLEK